MPEFAYICKVCKSGIPKEKLEEHIKEHLVNDYYEIILIEEWKKPVVK